MLTIAICGAGPVGLTLARLLLQSSTSAQIEVTLFEKDASSASRRSLGGTLDLHPPTGLAAMRKMNLWDAFKRYARFEGEELRVCDQNGTVYIHQIDAPQIEGFEARPEIDRVRLMEILLEAVPAELIKWGKAVAEVCDLDGGRGLRFADGTEEGPFDLIVGADGAWSKVRSQLTDVKPAYSGICGISGTITAESAGEHWHQIEGMVGRGTTFALSYRRGMTGQRLGDNTIKPAFYQRRELDWFETIKEKHGKDQDALKKTLLEEYKEWVPEFQSWITAAKDLWCMALWELPVGQRFEHKTGLTLIGDSAHLMTPFAGEGVNAGMRDALDLSAAIEKALEEKSDIDTAVKEFEESMFVRMAEFMQKTLINKNGMYADDAPYTFFTGMLGVVAEEMHYDLEKGWLSWLPIKSTAYGVLWSMGTFGAVRRRVTDLMRSKK